MEPRRVKDERLMYVRVVPARGGGEEVVVVGVSVGIVVLTWCLKERKLGRGGGRGVRDSRRQRVRNGIVDHLFRVPARSKGTH
jgi:hypothetical protein